MAVTFTIQGQPLEDFCGKEAFSQGLPFTPFYFPPKKGGYKPRALRRSPVRHLSPKDLKDKGE